VHLSATIIKGISVKEETTHTNLTILPVTLTQQEKSLPSYTMLDTGVTGVGSIIFNWLSCINEYHKLRERNKR
jgi:tellurite resistance protein TehA-like permease